MITTTKANQTHPNLTPNDLKPNQDMLLLAGSKVSFKDVYQQEIDLPVFRNKFYKADDVDNLFVLLNGIFTSVSEQAFRNDKALTEAREALNNSQTQVQKLTEQLKTIPTRDKSQETSDTNKTLQLETKLATVTQQLQDQTQSYQRLLLSSSTKMSDQVNMIKDLQQQISILTQKNEQAKQQIETLSQTTSQQQTTVTGLQSKYNMLSYKYNNLKTLSTQRIQMLEHENNKELS